MGKGVLEVSVAKKGRDVGVASEFSEWADEISRASRSPAGFCSCQSVSLRERMSTLSEQELKQVN